MQKLYELYLYNIDKINDLELNIVNDILNEIDNRFCKNNTMEITMQINVTILCTIEYVFRLEFYISDPQFQRKIT